VPMPRPSPKPRPPFVTAWAAFSQVNVPVADVGKKIGGRVEVNINIPPEQGGFENACPIRMSYVLNYSGFPITKNNLYAMVSGADRMQYLYRVPDMAKYLENTFGKPDKTVKGLPKTTDFSGMRGIMVVKGTGWGNAGGHVTLWDGTKCSDHCHLAYDPDNGSFIPSEASIWILR